MLEHTILWRRLEGPGHDSCGLWRFEGGWRLVGTSLFRAEGEPWQLRYEIECDPGWRTRWATVHGLAGRRIVSITIEAAAGGRWRLNGVEQPELASLVDVDLGFTPATNLIQLRRLAPEIGQTVDAPAAYLESIARPMVRLEQTYRRTGRLRYDYESPAFGYSATLQVSKHGFVTDYPGLWMEEDG